MAFSRSRRGGAVGRASRQVLSRPRRITVRPGAGVAVPLGWLLIRGRAAALRHGRYSSRLAVASARPSSSARQNCALRQGHNMDRHRAFGAQNRRARVDTKHRQARPRRIASARNGVPRLFLGLYRARAPPKR